MWEALSQRLEEGIRQIYLFLPRLLAAIGILMAGFAIAKMIERATDLALHKIGFDRWMNEGGVTEALERAGTRLDPSTVLAKLVFWTVMLLVILLAADALGIEAVNSLFAELVAYIPNVIAAVIVLVLGILLGEFVKDLVLASAGGLPGGPTLGRAAKASVILLAVFMALEQLNIAQDIVLVFFIAVVGAAALAAGIAFGLGGREIAAEVSRELYNRMKDQNAALRERHAVEPHNPLVPKAAPPRVPPPPSSELPPDIGTAPPNESRE
jgi:hypothetical protein